MADGKTDTKGSKLGWGHEARSPRWNGSLEQAILVPPLSSDFPLFLTQPVSVIQMGQCQELPVTH